MLKRVFDFSCSFFGLIILLPILSVFTLIIFLQDFKSPFYFGKRIGKNKKVFNMLKLRSMNIDSDKLGIDSTSSDDLRITKIGSIVRKLKIDELFQLFNKNSKDYLEIKSLKTWYQFIFEDGFKFDYSGDEEEMVNQIKKINEKDVNGYKNLVNFTKKIFDKGFTELSDVPLWNI